ncbi:hypothetical protein B0H13DRAFT_1870457 [Mycena leptocephala]|nr:hypothetical protein B0H13DRAFT_1870457 [Mycena leptocephala]
MFDFHKINKFTFNDPSLGGPELVFYRPEYHPEGWQDSANNTTCSSLFNFLDNDFPKLGPSDWMDVIRRKRRRLYNEIHDSLEDDAGQIQRWAEENLPLEVSNPAKLKQQKPKHFKTHAKT